jgi:WD40 repeat protein
MIPLSRVKLLAFVAMLAAGSPAAAQTDLYGDPLPDGAIARIGSARFRHAGLSDYVLLADGRTVLTAGGDRILRFWDLASGKPGRIVPLEGKGGPGSLVTLSPDGKTVAAQIANQFVLWDVESGKERKRLPAPKNGNVGFLYFAPDGKTLAVGRGDWRVSFIDVQTGAAREVPLAFRPAAVVEFHMDSTFHGSYSPDGKWFVAGASSLQPLAVFDTATGLEVHRLNGFARTSAVSPDSKRLAVCSLQNDKGEREAVIRIYDLASGKETVQFPFANDDSYYALAFAPDGKTLACGFSDNSCLVDLTTGRVLHRLTGRPLAPSFSGDGKTLIASTGHRLRRWDVTTGKELDERPGEFGYNPALAVSPDGRLLAAGDWMEQVVTVWDTKDGRPVRQLPLAGEKRYVRSVAFSGDGQTLVACQGMGFLQFWDTATGKVRRTVQLRMPGTEKDNGPYFFDLHVSPDGKHASALQRVFGPTGSLTHLALWDTANGKPAGAGYQLPGESRHSAWLAGGKLAVVPQGDALAMLDVASGTVAFRFESGARDKIVVSADGRLLAGRKVLAAGAKTDPRAVVWEAATGKEVATVTTDGFGQFALAPDNRCLITTEYGAVIVRDMATGAVRKRWPLPEAKLRTPNRTYFFALHLSPDGRRAFTVLADGTALVWDLTPAIRPAVSLVKNVDAQVLAACWADLAGADAANAQRAVWSLADAPREAVPFLSGRLEPVAVPEAKQVRHWIADLDSDDFEIRQAAQQELSRLAERIEPALQEALKGKVPVETRRRLETLLKSKHGIPPPEELRVMRAVQALELMGTANAQVLLRALAGGAAGARLTREAQAAMERLASRAP